MYKTNLVFNDSFFKGEFREGFFVEEEMKRCWAAQMEVICEIDKICKKYNLKWTADCGTLLGAVRHSGFVPWDDDTDIAMMRSDYNRFLQVVEKELPNGYVIYSPYSEKQSSQSFARIVNGDEVTFAKERLKKFHGSPYISGVDIFPLDYLPRNEDERILQRDLYSFAMLMSRSDKDTENYEQGIGKIEEFCNVKIDRDKDIKKQLLQLADAICSMYEEKDGDFLTTVAFYCTRQYIQIPKSAYDEIVMLPFENMMIPAPKGYTVVLEKWYGDYMKPVRNTSSHEYPYYKKQRVEIEKELDKIELEESRFKISKVLQIQDSEIKNLILEKKSWMNHTYSFIAENLKLIIRYTMEGSEKIINRERECAVYEKLRAYDFGEQILYISALNGMKIVKYIEYDRKMDKTNWNDIKICLNKLKQLHNLNIKIDYENNIYNKICLYEKLWCGEKSCYSDYDKVKGKIKKIDEWLKERKEKKVLVHMDATADNFLICKNENNEAEVKLIDFEYASMDEPMVDIAKFVLDMDCDEKKVHKIMGMYYAGYNEKELCKLYGYMAMLSLMESNWSEYQFRMGEPLGEKSIDTYQDTKHYIEKWNALSVKLKG